MKEDTSRALLLHVCDDGAYSRIDVIRSGDVPAGYSKYNAYFMTGTVEKIRQYMDTLFKRRVK